MKSESINESWLRERYVDRQDTLANMAKEQGCRSTTIRQALIDAGIEIRSRWDHAFRHGHSVGVNKSPTYKSWEMMCQRCLNQKYDSYKDYGARGISVCARWCGRGGFANFLTDMGERPLDTLAWTSNRVGSERLAGRLSRSSFAPTSGLWLSTASASSSAAPKT